MQSSSAAHRRCQSKYALNVRRLSDHLLFLNLFKAWQYEYDKGKSKKFCRENYVNEHSMDTIYFVKVQIYNILESIQLIKV